MDRFLVPALGPDDDALIAGLRWLHDYAERHGLREAAIILPRVDAIQSLGRVIGDDAARRATRDRRFAIGGVSVHLFTDQTARGEALQMPILIPWATDKTANAVEKHYPPAICAIPWTEDGLADWISAWNPIDPSTGEPVGAEGTTLSSARVELGLLSITESRNPATGLAHPSDRKGATRILKALVMCGEQLDETQIRRWAIANGWPPEDARDLSELAAKLAARRPVKGAAMTKTEAKQIVNRLRPEG